MRSRLRSLIFLPLLCAAARGQDNYEIQIYGSETVPPSSAMVELHSNFTPRGAPPASPGVVPTDHALHETLEITGGLTSWSEIGFYCFTNGRWGNGYQWVGSHIRPRVRAPAAWGWPVGASLSLEGGYQRPRFGDETWSLEIRPIIDGQFGPLYVSVNPAMDRDLSPGTRDPGLQFTPGFKLGLALDSTVTVGVEYYGSMGDISGFAPAAEQQHMVFPALDLDLSPVWEFNFGVGFGLTGSTDHLIVKLILGRRLEI